MTFEEAVELIGDKTTIDFEGDKLYLFVAPTDFNDRAEYRRFAKENYAKLTNEDAKKFSGNNQFRVVGIWPEAEDFSIHLL